MISQLLHRFRTLRLINSFVLLLSVIALVYISLRLFQFSYTVPLVVLLTILGLYYSFNNREFRAITIQNLLEHINRHYSDYQESAQLLRDTQNQEALSRLQRIQRDKIVELFGRDTKNGRFVDLRPKFRFKLPIGLAIISLILFFQGEYILSNINSLLISDNNIELAGITLDDNQASSNNPTVLSSRITISPPEYTGLPIRAIDQLNIEVEEGAQVLWSMNFSNSELEYFYTASQDSPRPFIKKEKKFIFKERIVDTKLYKFSYKVGKQFVDMEGIYSISVIRDQMPKVDIIEPQRTLVEYPKQSTPSFSLKVEVIDDFGITDVKILASVAKGSGEAVKFRDKVFRFPKRNQTKTSNESNKNNTYRETYQRDWRLSDLEMEPGDEVYFSIQVTDNKYPTRQMSKSNSIIIRWLDEDDFEMAAEGIQIRFVPEYFRSQRQIIIETEKLIEDKKDLSQQAFDETSMDLGHSQSDLKQKYGQYLGDEFGEGQGAQFGLADGYHGGETMSSGEASAGLETDEHDEQHQDEEQHPDEHEHHEEVSDGSSADSDLSGASQLIQKFGHNHLTVEVGPMSSKDPKSWMKMAVNEMWQAELYLMMSEPSKALPYEYNAYKYLKLARQAERVYAKRLGFEPPPVSEERRLTGELAEILEHDLSRFDLADNQSDSALFKRTYQLINRVSSTKSGELEKVKLNQTEFEQFSQLSQRLLELSKDRPVLVKYAAIAERLYLASSLQLSDCSGCLSELHNKLWQLIEKPVSRPILKTKRHNIDAKLEKQYLESYSRIRENK